LQWKDENWTAKTDGNNNNNNNNNNNQYIYKQRQSHAMSQRRWLATVPTETARLNDVEHLSDIQKEQQGANDRALVL